MNYDVFRLNVQQLPLITLSYLRLLFDNSQILSNQLLRWQKQSKIIKLRRGAYQLNKNDRKINPSRLHISGELYKPSYVSMEYALAFYGLIPERVTDMTAITTKKTYALTNILGTFIYHKLKSTCFTGFTVQRDEAGLPYFLAVPEKAVVDFIYLNMHRFKTEVRKILNEFYRFQNLDSLKKSRLELYAGLFKSKKLTSIVKLIR